ncbi:MAG TPA: polyribonucleotide nucleotidyltransferase, partial [bacterium]|nr:polyribonucleotide nucleotidyltransferase [bacterium]
KDIADAVYSRVKKVMRAKILATRERLDGRQPHEYRHVRGEFGLLPRTHGSALFERGITQALTITTLGGPGDAQLIDDMYEEETKRYIHHYNFPPYSVGEVKPLRGVGRREIGHGRLAEKALEPVLPSLESFPYFIRVVSEITTCNGSSSMASVCGSSMSLMDAGVPIRAIVSGVAMGMVFDEETRRYEILTDIQAQEDFLGDMDFKIARTQRGITALQMDCKIKGLPLSVLSEIFARATDATDGIRADMTRGLSAPREALSPYAPSILSHQILVEQIREVIGKGGETVQKIERDYGVDVHITDEGLVTVTGRTQESGQAAMDHIRAMLRGVEVGDVLDGVIIRIIDGTGAIVDLGSGKSGMIHISKLGVAERVTDITKYVNPGDTVRVRVAVVDKEKNRIGLERIIEG